MLVAVELNTKKCCSWEQSHLKLGANSGKAKGFTTHANPELNSRPFGFDKCVETIHPASTSCVDEERVHALPKDRGFVTYRNYDFHWLKSVASQGNLRLKNDPNSGNAKGNPAHANPELNSKSFDFDKCVENIEVAPAMCG